MIGQIVALELLGATVTAAAFSNSHNTIVLIGEIIVGIVGAWLLIRSRQAKQSIANAADAQKMAGEWRDNYLAERQAREDKEQEALEQRELKHAALADVAALRMSTDLTAVMTALIEIQKTGTKSLEVLEKIVRRLDRIDPPPLKPLKEAV